MRIHDGRVPPEDVADAGPVPKDATTPSPAPMEPIDYSCTQASDCAIKNVGNCCGYFPRCINAQREPPPPQCSTGAVSPCGWPEITHCECVENTCRSMQGELDV